MVICVLLSRLTGWGLAEVLALPADEVKEWLDAALEVEKKLNPPLKR